MKLLSIQLENFRPFFGKTPALVLGTPGPHNVTVVHGSNGAGKTALLNAFTWALYGQVTRGFQYPEQLINKRALRNVSSGEMAEAWVELRFEHGDWQYSLRRTARARLEGATAVSTGEPAATLQSCGPDGRWKQERHIEDAIGRILPVDLHGYFFFDGERIERIVDARDEEQAELGKATKTLLGLEILIRAATHLDKVRRDLEKELQEVGDSATKGLLEEKRAKEVERERLGAEVKEVEKNRVENENFRREIDRRLRELKEVEDVQKRRDQLQDEQERRIGVLDDTRRELADLVSTKSFAVFLGPAMESFGETIEALRERGELPAGIKQQFVEDLLGKGTCICGRELGLGTPPRMAVEDWKARAGLGDVEEKAIRMGGEIRALKQLVPDTVQRVDRLQRRNFAEREELARIERELDEIRARLEHNPKEEISRLELRRTEVGERISSADRELGGLAEQLETIGREIEALDQRLSRQQIVEEKQRVARERVMAARDARKRVVEVRRLVEQEFRSGLEELVGETFRRISVTPYTPEIGDDWALRLLESSGGQALVVPASQGENQILSLAFIASIIKLAKRKAAEDNPIGPASAVYPMVMDSPFGSLDPIYRHQIAEHVPVLADQVVLMLTESQWRGEVEQSLRGKVGRTYVMTYHTTRDDVEAVEMDVGGELVPLVKRSPNEFEYTEVREVGDGR